jgi:hypothetical protein
LSERSSGVLGSAVTFDEMEAALPERLQTFPPAARAELVHVPPSPGLERVERIGEFWGHPETQTFELLIDCEEDRTFEGGELGAAQGDGAGEVTLRGGR